MTDRNKNRIAGSAGGLVNGLFGGGGGMVLLPLLTKWSALEARSAFATCVAVIFPMCCVSTVVYLWEVRPALELVLPYLAGGVAGGLAGGLTFERVRLTPHPLPFYRTSNLNMTDRRPLL